MGIKFKHNEKTDFIMNMTAKGYQKLCFIFLMISTLSISLGTLVYYIAKGNEKIDGTAGSFGRNIRYNNEAFKYIQLVSIFLIVLGFFGLLVWLIPILKKQFKFKENKGLLLIGMYLVFAVVSTALAYNVQIAVYGQSGRFEGLITIIAYIGLFLAATQLSENNKKRTLVDIIIAIGVINSIAGIFQSFYKLDGIIPTFFTIALNGQQRLYANGFATSPFALAALLTMTLGLSVNGFMHENNNKRKLFYGVSSMLFVFAGLLTTTLPAIVGMGTVLITAIVIEVRRLATGHGLWKKGFTKNPLGLGLLCVLGGLVIAGIMLLTKKFAFNDAAVVVLDSFNRLQVSYPRFNSVNGLKIYPKVWREVGGILKDNWIFGTGPDGIGIEKYSTSELYSIVGTSDRAYNQYLNIATTTGLPSLLACMGFLLVVLKRAFNGIKKFFNLEENWTKSAVTTACIGFLVQAFFNISVITVSPIFFILLGLAYSKNSTKSQNNE